MDALTVDTLAKALQEPKRPLLTQVLRTLGQDRTRAVLTATLEHEAAGGMLTKDGTRRRTPGGTFFQLVRQQVSPQERQRLFPWQAPQHGQGQPQRQPTALTWGEAQIVTQTLATHPAGPSNNIAVMECQIALRYIASSALLSPFLEAETDEAILARGGVG